MQSSTHRMDFKLLIAVLATVFLVFANFASAGHGHDEDGDLHQECSICHFVADASGPPPTQITISVPSNNFSIFLPTTQDLEQDLRALGANLTRGPPA